MSELLAYDAAKNVIATLGHVVASDESGHALGLVDFDSHEQSGGRLRDIWEVSGAVGSGTWPEWLGGAAHSFRVELDSSKRIVALVHKTSGQRRERAAIVSAIEAVPVIDGKRDIRHLVGGPTRPLTLDEHGRNATRSAGEKPPHLPIIGR
jgi:hypothetical protein